MFRPLRVNLIRLGKKGSLLVVWQFLSIEENIKYILLNLKYKTKNIITEQKFQTYLPFFVQFEKIKQIIILQIQKMEKDALKIKKLGLKNKKLLQSISAHLLKNSESDNEIIQECKSLQEKYQQLMHFNRENVQQNQKMQEEIFAKNERIKELKLQYMESKEQAFQEEEKIKNQIENITDRFHFERIKQQQMIQRLKQENCENKRTYLKQQKFQSEELKQYKSKCQELNIRKQLLIQENKQAHEKYEQKVKQMQRIINEQKVQMNRLSKHNDGIEGEISKRRKINSLEEAKGMIGEYRKRKL